MTGISVIVCAYNPDTYIFTRVLNAIFTCQRPLNLGFECLLIDNNSVVPLAREKYISDIIAKIPGAKIFVEKKQGLTSARRRGIIEAKYSHLLFIDDDNEVDEEYFIQMEYLAKRYPNVAAFNAGVIRVNYIGKVDKWFEDKGKSHFQESDLKETIYGNDSSSFKFWPFGTGLMVTKEVCDYYENKIAQGIFTLSDRNGKEKTSGGDGQIVVCAIELGYSIGRATELKLNHLISSEKANINYLSKIDYGIYFSGELFTKESLPGNLNIYSTSEEIKMVLNIFIMGGIKAIVKNRFREFSLQKANLLGRLNGNRQATGKKPSWFLNSLSKQYV